MNSRQLAVLFCILFCLVFIVHSRQIIIKNRKFYDKQGRELYFHGANVVPKVPPYIPITDHYDPEFSFNQDDLKILRDNGFNSIRLGMSWAGLQPKKDWYNQTFLSQMVKIVNSAGKVGIYSLIQFHQDILSQKFCGDGVPIWLMDELNSYKYFPLPVAKHIKLNASGLPDWNDCDQSGWAKYYFSYDVGQGFNNLYNLKHKLNHKFNAYWKKIAETFKGNPYVIAYQLINQPWIGNVWKNPTLSYNNETLNDFRFLYIKKFTISTVLKHLHQKFINLITVYSFFIFNCDQLFKQIQPSFIEIFLLSRNLFFYIKQNILKYIKNQQSNPINKQYIKSSNQNYYNSIFVFFVQKMIFVSRSKTLWLFALLSLIVFVHMREVNVRNLKFYDKEGRQIYLHGTNVVVKVPPYIPSTGAYDPVWSFNSDDIKILRDNGFNSLRLGLMWAGVQPKKDWYNQTFLAQMVKIVNAAGQAGIYTLIDFHQDLLSQKFCGDGVPIWLMDEINSYKSFPFPMGKHIKLNGSGLPDWKDCDQNGWGKYYFSYDVGQGFNDLYNTNHKLNHKFNAYWKKVAQTFKGNPYVIAYELINQPFIGNFWRNPTLVIPSQGQRMKLQHFYDKLSVTIRSVDSQTPLCFQPVTFDNFVPTGFSHAPGGKRFSNQSVFCYHHYQPPALGLKSLDTYVKDGKKLGVTSLLSQTFGSPQTLDRAQYWKQGWMYWNYKSYGKNWGSPQQKYGKNQDHQLHNILTTNKKGDIRQGLVRTYFQRVAGQLQQSQYNTTTSHFQGSYFAQPAGQTILFIGKNVNYKTGYSINVYPKQQIQVGQNGNWVTIKYTGTQREKRILVTVDKL